MTKAPCEAALMCERHVRIEISDFVMRTFVPRKKALNADAQSSNLNKNHEVTTAKSCFFGFCLLPSRLYCRYRNLTGSCAAALADFTADRELHPALKTSFDSIVMFYCYSCYYFKAELSRGKFFCAAGVFLYPTKRPHKKQPKCDRHRGQKRRQQYRIGGKYTVCLHVLRHDKAGNGRRRSGHNQNGNHLTVTKPEARCQRQEHSRKEK